MPTDAKYIKIVFVPNDYNIEIEIESNIISIYDGYVGDGYINGYAYVDLGLPSGLKWATCNIGADSPGDYGEYFAWGEISSKTSYNANNSLTYGKSDFNSINISGNPEYDAAAANWGGSWRMPTREEFEELINNCKWEYLGGIVKVSNRLTGKFIILPNAGYASGSSLLNRGNYGYYWTSNSLYDYYYAICFNIYDYSERTYFSEQYRYCGQSIRPVSD